MKKSLNYTLEQTKEIVKSKNIKWDVFCKFSFNKQKHILNA